MNETLIKQIKHALISALIALALCMDMGIPDLHLVPIQEREALFAMPSLVWNLYGSVRWLPFTIMWGVLFLALHKVNCERGGIINLIVSVFISVNFWAAQGFAMSDDLGILVSSLDQLIKSIIYLTGVSCLIYLLIGCVFIIFDNNKGHSYKDEGKKEIVKYALIILLGWMPNIVINYPGTLAADTVDELVMFFSGDAWNSKSPLFHVWFTGWLFRLGGLISGNFAIFLNVLVQSIVFALILSYLLATIKKLNSPKWLLYSVMCSLWVIPYYANYITIVLKDSIYSYCFLLFMIELVYMWILKEKYFKDVSHIFLWTISVIGTMLFRNNGKLILFPSIVIVLIAFMKNVINSKILIRIIAVFSLPFVVSLGISAILTASNGAVDVSMEENLSLPFQQTARFILYHGDEVLEDERLAISEILEYDRIAEEYNPRVSDPLKSLVKCASYDVVKKYLAVWIKMGLRHPDTYMAAILNQNYYMIYPGIPNNISSTSIVGGGWLIDMDSSSGIKEKIHSLGFDVSEPLYLRLPQKILFLIYQAVFFAPILGLVSHPAFYVLLFFMMLAFAINKKNKEYLIVCIPIFINIIGVVFGPAIQRHPRYLFPVIFSTPLLLAYYLYVVRKV